MYIYMLYGLTKWYFNTHLTSPLNLVDFPLDVTAISTIYFYLNMLFLTLGIDSFSKAFYNSTSHILVNTHILNITYPKHPTSPTSHIFGIPHAQDPKFLTSHIPDIPHPQHPTSSRSHIPNIPQTQHPTFQTYYITQHSTYFEFFHHFQQIFEYMRASL